MKPQAEKEQTHLTLCGLVGAGNKQGGEAPEDTESLQVSSMLGK